MPVEVKFKRGEQSNLSTATKTDGTYYQCTDTGRLYLCTSTDDGTLVEVGNLINDSNGDSTSLKLQGTYQNSVLGQYSMSLNSSNSLISGSYNASIGSDNIKIDSLSSGVTFISSKNCFSASASSSTENTKYSVCIASTNASFGSGYVTETTDANYSFIAANSGGTVYAPYSVLLGGSGGSIQHSNCVVLGGGITTDQDNMVYVKELQFVSSSTKRSRLRSNSSAGAGELIFDLPTTGGTLALTGEVTASQTLTSGTEIGRITVKGTDVIFYAPSGGGGGSSVSYTPSYTSGTQAGTLTIDSTDYGIFVPTVSVSQILTSGTEIATISIGDETTTIYAPSGSEQATPDWDAEVGEDGYIENRTHYRTRIKSSSKTTLIDQNFTFTHYTDFGNSSIVDNEGIYALENGERYNITIDGTVYNNVICKKVYDEGWNGYYNGLEFGDFQIVYLSDDGHANKYFKITDNTNELDTASIIVEKYNDTYTYVQLDENYIPSTIARTSDIPTVSVSQIISEGTKIATITINDTSTDIYAPNGTTVSYTPTLTSGTELGKLTINGSDTTIYGTSASYTATVTSGTELGVLNINGSETTIYAEGEITAADVDLLFED